MCSHVVYVSVYDFYYPTTKHLNLSICLKQIPELLQSLHQNSRWGRETGLVLVSLSKVSFAFLRYHKTHQQEQAWVHLHLSNLPFSTIQHKSVRNNSSQD